MQRTIGAFEARRNFGKILQGVAARGDRIIVERHGEPIAAVVPMYLYKQLEQQRARFAETLELMRNRANLSEEDAEKLAREAVQAVRREAR